jgi:hypothetical protein
MNDSNKTVSDFRHARQVLRSIILEVRKNEEDKNYAEYCEGILEAARAALNLIASE